MIGDRIHSGDVVFLRSQDHVQDGEIAAVALDNEVTLKHVRRLRGPDGNIAFTQLLPSEPGLRPIDIGGEGETRMVRILGKAVAVRFMLVILHSKGALSGNLPPALLRYFGVWVLSSRLTALSAPPAPLHPRSQSPSAYATHTDQTRYD